MEIGSIKITRARTTQEFPSRFQLVAAMNPCPCGRMGVGGARCLCSKPMVEAYVRKLSQPILDRIDLHIELKAAPLESLLQSDGKEDERDRAALRMREEVIEARGRQYRRQKMLNARLSGRDLSRLARLGASSEALLRKAAERFGLSARGYVRILRTARTIADLEGVSEVADSHVAEALGYRCLQALVGPAGS